MKVKKDLKNLITVFSCVGLSIISYHILLKIFFKDDIEQHNVLNLKLFNLNIFDESCCSSWPLTHLIFYFIVTFIWPQYWYYIFGFGIFWEIFESIMSILTTPKNQKSILVAVRSNNNKVEYATWWGASKKDIVFNSVGIAGGLLFSYLLKK